MTQGKKRYCMECRSYRPMSFTDDGSDAWCGRCTIPGPSGKRIRKVRPAMNPACAEFQPKEDSRDDGAKA